MNEYKIMAVDDEPDILDLLEKALRIEGFPTVIKIDTGRKAVNACKEIQPDIIILDVMLPDIDGYEVCRQIRQFSHCPILFLSSKNDELDKILGLAVGGDDYVTKPFSPKEIAYRVKAQLRRMEYRQSPCASQTIEIGALTIDTDGCRALKDGRDLELTAREFEILQYLANSLGISKDTKLLDADGKNISAKDIPSGSSVKVTVKDAFNEETPFYYPVVYEIRLIDSGK